jgi:hypothetical protein
MRPAKFWLRQLPYDLLDQGPTVELAFVAVEQPGFHVGYYANALKCYQYYQHLRLRGIKEAVVFFTGEASGTRARLRELDDFCVLCISPFSLSRSGAASGRITYPIK